MNGSSGVARFNPTRTMRVTPSNKKRHSRPCTGCKSNNALYVAFRRRVVSHLRSAHRLASAINKLSSQCDFCSCDSEVPAISTIEAIIASVLVLIICVLAGVSLSL